MSSMPRLLSLLQKSEPQHATVTEKLIHSKLSTSQDDGLGIVSLAVSSKCPLSKQRIETPVKSKHCLHIQCFDAAAYFLLVCRNSLDKWKCPVCNCKAYFKDLIVDEFMVDLLEKLPKSVEQVEFLRDGTWRAKQTGVSVKEINMKANSFDLVDLTITPVKERKRIVIDLTTPPKVNKKHSFNSVIDLTMSP